MGGRSMQVTIVMMVVDNQFVLASVATSCANFILRWANHEAVCKVHSAGIIDHDAF